MTQVNQCFLLTSDTHLIWHTGWYMAQTHCTLMCKACAEIQTFQTCFYLFIFHCTAVLIVNVYFFFFLINLNMLFLNPVLSRYIIFRYYCPLTSMKVITLMTTLDLQKVYRIRTNILYCTMATGTQHQAILL